MDWALLVAGLEFLMTEAALFAACGFLVLGIGDLAVDILWIGLRLRGGSGALDLRMLKPPAAPGRLAVFVAAWDEAAVIGEMLRAALRTFDHADYRLYVGCYPNDPRTIAAVSAVADPRVRLVIGTAPGPTTKADCLNRLWEALLDDEMLEGQRVKAVILHDAEDVVHSAELSLFDALTERFDLVQLPVLPLIDRNSRWVGGHYADEFAEAHGKDLVVRDAIGAAIPSAGVGCAFSRDALERIAELAGGLPFDADSLTEDYELGLRIKAGGGTAAFVRMRAGAGLVATRAYFPSTVRASVGQKARWIAGIALAGWDRLGWSGGAAERWMRIRDRQSLVAAMLLLAGYSAFALWVSLNVAGVELQPLPPALSTLIAINMALLAWRLAMRCGFVACAYGWREGLRAAPRMAVSNMIALLAGGQALSRYRLIRRTGRTYWQKTAHIFPEQVPAE